MDFLQDIVERAKSYKQQKKEHLELQIVLLATNLQKLYLSGTLTLSVNLPINGG